MENFSEKIQSLRNEYSDLDLTSEDLNQDPITQFKKWLDEAIETQIYEPNAMVLATVDKNAPRSRYVLFKNIVNNNLIFHTHYESPKAVEIFSNPNVSGISFPSYSFSSSSILFVTSSLDEMILLCAEANALNCPPLGLVLKYSSDTCESAFLAIP